MSELTDNLNKFPEKVEAALMMYADICAKDLQNYMRDNAKWTDRTGNARKSLTASKPYKENPTTITIELSHGSNVPYGVYLELAHEKKYAIIQPTIQANQNQIMKNFEYLVNKLR